MTPYKAPDELRIGHVHLKVSNLERSVQFYRDRLGFQLLFQLRNLAFLSVNNYHHHIALNTWESLGTQPGPARAPGLYHFALNYPTQRALAEAVKHLLDTAWTLDGSADHTSHLAVYLSDPDGNGIELAWDRDPSFWQGWLQGLTEARVHELNKPLDISELIASVGT